MTKLFYFFNLTAVHLHFKLHKDVLYPVADITMLPNANIFGTNLKTKYVIT